MRDLQPQDLWRQVQLDVTAPFDYIARDRPGRGSSNGFSEPAKHVHYFGGAGGSGIVTRLAISQEEP